MRWLLGMLLCVPGAASAQDPGTTREVEGIEFVWCPPGEFQQGSSIPADTIAERFGGKAAWYSDEFPRIARTISTGFWISKTEITKEQWSGLMQTQPWEAEFKNANMQEPAVMITWEEAKAFARELGNRAGALVRLPTETEWEYACRAGTDTPYSFGDELDKLQLFAQYRLNVPTSLPQPVAKRGANAWGLHDVHGNVWEWCNDKYALYGSGRSPAGAHFRVIRGGAVNGTAAFLRSSYRAGVAADTRSPRVGFRVVCEAEEE